MIGKREFEEYYEALKARPLFPELAARGWNAGECAAVPYETAGELLTMTAEDFERISKAIGYPKCNDLKTLHYRVEYLPRIAGLAFKGYWYAFMELVQIYEGVIPDAYELFYDDMPQRFKRNFIMGAFHVEEIEE